MSNKTPTDALRLVPIDMQIESILHDLVEEVSAAQRGARVKARARQCCARGAAKNALLNLLAAAPASPLPGGGWQDISTAPKDGTEVLVMLKPKVIRLGWYFKPSSRTEGWCDENGKRIIPSHWMPLPAAPRGDA